MILYADNLPPDRGQDVGPDLDRPELLLPATVQPPEFEQQLSHRLAELAVERQMPRQEAMQALAWRLEVDPYVLRGFLPLPPHIHAEAFSRKFIELSGPTPDHSVREALSAESYYSETRPLDLHQIRRARTQHTLYDLLRIVAAHSGDHAAQSFTDRVIDKYLGNSSQLTPVAKAEVVRTKQEMRLRNALRKHLTISIGRRGPNTDLPYFTSRFVDLLQESEIPTDDLAYTLNLHRESLEGYRYLEIIPSMHTLRRMCGFALLGIPFLEEVEHSWRRQFQVLPVGREGSRQHVLGLLDRDTRPGDLLRLIITSGYLSQSTPYGLSREFKIAFNTVQAHLADLYLTYTDDVANKIIAGLKLDPDSRAGTTVMRVCNQKHYEPIGVILEHCYERGLGIADTLNEVIDTGAVSSKEELAQRIGINRDTILKALRTGKIQESKSIASMVQRVPLNRFQGTLLYMMGRGNGLWRWEELVKAGEAELLTDPQQREHADIPSWFLGELASNSGFTGGYLRKAGLKRDIIDKGYIFSGNYFYHNPSYADLVASIFLPGDHPLQRRAGNVFLEIGEEQMPGQLFERAIAGEITPGELIRTIRYQQRLTPTEFGTAAGVEKQRVWQWERGAISLEQLRNHSKLKQALKLPGLWL